MMATLRSTKGNRSRGKEVASEIEKSLVKKRELLDIKSNENYSRNQRKSNPTTVPNVIPMSIQFPSLFLGTDYHQNLQRYH